VDHTKENHQTPLRPAMLSKTAAKFELSSGLTTIFAPVWVRKLPALHTTHGLGEVLRPKVASKWKDSLSILSAYGRAH